MRLKPPACTILSVGLLSCRATMAAQESAGAWGADGMMLGGLAVIVYVVWKVLRLLDK